MKETKIYGSLLVLLLAGAYWSYSKGDSTPSSAESEKVDIVDVPKDGLKGLVFYAKTSTVEVSSKKDEKGEEYTWFVVEQGKRKRSFAGNDKVKAMLEGFTPFKALRSLGRLSADELKETKLDKPEKKLVLRLRDGERTVEVGGRTHSARDHYVRTPGGQEVYLVASAVLGDLEFPEGRFMQRKLREEAVKDLSKAEITVNGKTKTFLQKNRLSPSEAFWSNADQETKNETVENYIDKLDKLAAVEYPNDDEKYPRNGVPILEVTWYGDDETKPINHTEIWKVEDPAKKLVDYYAISELTRVPVKLSKYAAEQIERDLTSVMAD